MVGSIINVTDKELLAPVADAVKARLGMNDTQLGLVRSSVFLTALLDQLLSCPLSDRYVKIRYHYWNGFMERTDLDDHLRRPLPTTIALTPA